MYGNVVVNITKTMYVNTERGFCAFIVTKTYAYVGVSC
jgi:hypothetical protein